MTKEHAYAYESGYKDGYTARDGEIVRCRDCEHYDPHLTEGGVCFLPDGDGDFARWEVEPDGYCAWACRKSE